MTMLASMRDRSTTVNELTGSASWLLSSCWTRRRSCSLSDSSSAILSRWAMMTAPSSDDFCLFFDLPSSAILGGQHAISQCARALHFAKGGGRVQASLGQFFKPGRLKTGRERGEGGRVWARPERSGSMWFLPPFPATSSSKRLLSVLSWRPGALRPCVLQSCERELWKMGSNPFYVGWDSKTLVGSNPSRSNGLFIGVLECLAIIRDGSGRIRSVPCSLCT